MTYLRSSGDELAVRSAVYSRAFAIQSERRNAEMKALFDAIGAVIKTIAKRPTL